MQVFSIALLTLLCFQSFERQLTSAQAKQQEFDDVVIQIEREKAAWARQLENLRKELETEMTKRSQLEKASTAQNREIVQLKDRCVKLDRDLDKAQKDMSQKDWEITQLRSKQDKTIVEHVHVLQEAKAFTDRQLAEAQTELEKQKAYIKSLEKAKARLVGESEDLARETERERHELRVKEKALRANEEKASRALEAMELERTTREAAEIQAKRLQDELGHVKSQLADASKQMATIQRAKTALEAELENLADEMDNEAALSKIRQQYEARIAALETEAKDAANLRATAERIKQQIERQHAELRRLISSSGPRDDTFKARLLKELEQVDRELLEELSSRSSGRSDGTRSYANLPPSTPKKRQDANGVGRQAPDTPRTPDRQATKQLEQQVHALELQMLASNRVRQHLEASLRELTEDLDGSDGSKQSLQAHRAKLARENARLKELLDDEGKARQTASTAQLDSVKAMWDKFQQTISGERESYTKLEDSRRALVGDPVLTFDAELTSFPQLAQQRSAQLELEDNRRQVTELTQAKKQLQSQVADLRERLEVEALAKTREAGTFLILSL